MVTICEGRRSEKDSAINSFIQETVGQIRSTLFFFFGQNQVNIFFFFGQIRWTWQKSFSHNMLLCSVQSILIFSDNHINGASAQYLYLFRCHDDHHWWWLCWSFWPVEDSNDCEVHSPPAFALHLGHICVVFIFAFLFVFVLYLICICAVFVFHFICVVCTPIIFDTTSSNMCLYFIRSCCISRKYRIHFSNKRPMMSEYGLYL